nr:MAG TPA: hypothetical protein [Caudoviricetes sp.]
MWHDRLRSCLFLSLLYYIFLAMSIGNESIFCYKSTIATLMPKVSYCLK